MSSYNPSFIKKSSLLIALILVVGYMSFKWQSSNIDANQLTEPSSTSNASETRNTNAPVSRIEFLTSVFKDIKPPPKVARIVLQKASQASTDSVKYALNWAVETNNNALSTLLRSDLLEFHGEGNLEEVARESIFLAASQLNEQKQRDFLFQKGKRWIDEGLNKDEKNMPLRNALIIYQSEYLNQPMVFLKTLRASQKIDSSDVELNFIHLNLLKKSNQWQKAIQKCEKLVSLQPQNPYWLFEMSDLYGTLGDSANAKVYLNLAIKRQRKQSEK
jgi:tetratricopeptide (TPR) repeat protein